MATDEPNPRGRPPLPPEQRRDAPLVVRIESWRLSRYREAARKSGQRFIDFVTLNLDAAAKREGVEIEPRE